MQLLEDAKSTEKSVYQPAHRTIRDLGSGPNTPDALVKIFDKKKAYYPEEEDDKSDGEEEEVEEDDTEPEQEGDEESEEDNDNKNEEIEDEPREEEDRGDNTEEGEDEAEEYQPQSSDVFEDILQMEEQREKYADEAKDEDNEEPPPDIAQNAAEGNDALADFMQIPLVIYVFKFDQKPTCVAKKHVLEFGIKIFVHIEPPCQMTDTGWKLKWVPNW